MDRRATATPSTCRLPDGREIAYATAGDPDGRLLLACHGTPGSRGFARFYDDVARRAGVRVVAPDRPGLGNSDPDPDRTVDGWADDATALLDELDADRASVVGFSGGGPHALACAARCERVDRAAVVAGMAPVGAVSYPRMLSALGTLSNRLPTLASAVYRLQAALLRRGGPDTALSLLTDEGVGDVAVADGSTVGDVLHEELLAAFTAGPSGGVADTAAVNGDWGFDPATASVPVRWWHGTADENVPPDAADWAARTLPDVTVDRVDGRDHLGTLVATREAVVGWV